MSACVGLHIRPLCLALPATFITLICLRILLHSILSDTLIQAIQTNHVEKDKEREVQFSVNL